MDLSLSSSLVGSATLNPDKLSLDLQFATDKTLVARKGPTPTFTRASGATQINDSGLIEFAPENLIIRSQELDVSPWAKNASMTVTANTEIAPDGTLTADTVNNSAAGANFLIANSVAVSALVPHVFSFYAKKGTATSTIAKIFNDTTGTVITTLNYSSLISTTEWTRVSITFTPPAGCLAIGCRIRNDDGIGTVHLWGAQLERYSTARTYIPTTTAAVYGARFDHDPVTLACRGLLIEESRTNQVIQSEDLGTTWSTDGGKVAVSTNVIASPSGATNADKITENSTLLERKILIGGVTAVASTVYTYSCFLKAGERDVAQLAFGGTFGNQFQNFIIGGVNAGTLGSGSGITSPQITAFPNGWYRCTATVTSAGSGATQVTIGPADSSTLTRWAAYIGTVGSGIYAWGAQVEAGAFPTSYIPTTTASVVRSQDLCSITGSAFTGMYNAVAGTMLAGHLFRSATTSRPLYIGDGTSATNTMEFFNGTGSITSNVFSGGSQQYSQSVSATNNTMVNTALAVTASSAMLVVNGTLATAGGGLMPVGVNQLIIGNRPDGARNLNGHISFIKYFKKRLANSKLQALTT